MEVRVIRIKDSELAHLLRLQGNFDYQIDIDCEKVYVRKGVNKVWISLVKEQDVVLCIKSEYGQVDLYGDLENIIKKVVKEYLTTTKLKTVTC